MYTIEKIAQELSRMGNRLRPITKLEIQEIEEKFQVKLPEVYKSFLKTMGKNAGSFMMGSSVFYPDILSLRDWANETLAENGISGLPENVFVFWMHQGYQIAYFKLDEGDNPPVYFFAEGEYLDDFYKRDNSLIDFFVSELNFLKAS